MYNTFICTNFGIFNTITGTYEPYFPYLYFKVQKGYACYLPGDKFLNDRLVKYIPKIVNIVDTFVKNQKTIYYLTVMVPGMLNLSQLVLEPHECNILFLDIFNNILDDKSKTAKQNIYYTIPLIFSYNLNIDILINIMTAIKHVFDDKRSVGLYNFTPEDVNTWFEKTQSFTPKHIM
jgi:hypothetical protein